jgi:hypothetical protein
VSHPKILGETQLWVTLVFQIEDANLIVICSREESEGIFSCRSWARITANWKIISVGRNEESGREK